MQIFSATQCHDSNLTNSTLICCELFEPILEIISELLFQMTNYDIKIHGLTKNIEIWNSTFWTFRHNVG